MSSCQEICLNFTASLEEVCVIHSVTILGSVIFISAYVKGNKNEPA